VFPVGPERGVYNNALLDRDLGPAARMAAVDAMESVYHSAGIERFAAWVHESDDEMRNALSSRGYTVDETTRAMGMTLSGGPPAFDVELVTLEWTAFLEYLQAVGAPAGLLAGADPRAFHLLAARDGADHIATALAFDHDGDCGLFNMSTVEPARRRGFATALTARHLHDAAGRGCTTASLQATPMAEHVYASVGFRDLGRFLEYVPRLEQATTVP
jgi:GNAT superfamily N-acetyltransferase